MLRPVRQKPCRALLIAQTYGENDSIHTLCGSENDVAAFCDYLTQLDQQGYHVTICTDLQASQILSAISDAFLEADDDDVSLLYYSGHGVSDEKTAPLGSLLGADEIAITSKELQTAMQRIGGKKIMITDACNSGGLLADTVEWSNTNCSILTSCAYYETAKEDGIYGKTMGLFTADILEGIGYCSDGAAPPADYDCDKKVTLLELYLYTRRKMAEFGLHPQLFIMDDIPIFSLNE